jgi:hypothetical protein
MPGTHALQVNLPTGNFYYVKKQVADSAFATQVLCIVRDSNPSLGARYVGEQPGRSHHAGRGKEGSSMISSCFQPAAALQGLMPAVYNLWQQFPSRHITSGQRSGTCRCQGGGALCCGQPCRRPRTSSPQHACDFP